MLRSPASGFVSCGLLAAAWYALPTARTPVTWFASFLALTFAALLIGWTMRVPVPEAVAFCALCISAGAVVKAFAEEDSTGIAALIGILAVAAAAGAASDAIREGRVRSRELALALVAAVWAICMLAGATWFHSFPD